MGACLQEVERAPVSESTRPPQPRKLGRYEIVAEIGKGAMGTVYKAVDPLLERTVALKTVSVPAGDPKMLEYEARFYQEAKAAGSLNHPNIVTVYDVGKSGNVPFLAMEYLEGSELNEIMRHCNPLPPAHAVEIAVQVADALAYAHDRGVVHRDVKPANIMVVRDGLVKITDFGIARMRSSDRAAETYLAGSPRYMSPEQVLRKRAEEPSDIFSLGVVLYEMLTGAPPFSGADLNAIMFQIVNREPPPVSAVSGALPRLLESIVSKALAKEPDTRYPTARELASELRACRTAMQAAPTLAQMRLPAQGAEKAPVTDADATLAHAPPLRHAPVTDAAADEFAATLDLGKNDERPAHPRRGDDERPDRES